MFNRKCILKRQFEPNNQLYIYINEPTNCEASRGTENTEKETLTNERNEEEGDLFLFGSL